MLFSCNVSSCCNNEETHTILWLFSFFTKLWIPCLGWSIINEKVLKSFKRIYWGLWHCHHLENYVNKFAIFEYFYSTVPSMCYALLQRVSIQRRIMCKKYNHIYNLKNIIKNYRTSCKKQNGKMNSLKITEMKLF